MNRWKWFPAALLALVMLASAPRGAHAESDGQEDLDEALRVKVTAENLRDLNQVVELLESALDKGLEVENSDFAEQLLSETLMERGAQLTAVVQSVPAQKLIERPMQRVRDLAVADLRRVLEYDNPPPQAKMLLSQLLSLPGGNRPEAHRLLDELFEDEAVAALPPAVRAESLALRASLQKEPAMALADLNAAIELAPASAEYRLARADFQREQQKLDEALADVTGVLEKNPDEAAAHLLMAQILRDQKKFDEALASLNKTSALAPTAPGPYQQRGEIYRAQGELAKAIEQFNKVLQLQPGMLLPLIHRAEAYVADKQYDEALVDVEAVLKDNPEVAVAHGLRAQALAGLERLPEAIAELKELADSLPEELEFRMQLALYYLIDKQPRKSIEAYTDVLAHDADNFLALRSRGDAYLNVGEHAPAVADFEQALKVEPEDEALLNNLAWVLATSPDDAVRDGKRAIELATKACELSKYEKPHILSTLAAAYAETGDFETARKWSQKAVDLNDPEHAEQLAKELASYQENKPWRERQTTEDAPAKSPDEKPSAAPEANPATAEAAPKPVGL